MTAIELQSLRLLCAIMETRSVSRAADALEISQPAASYLLGQCRKRFGDPLFLKSNKGMMPTPKTLSLYQELRRGIDLLDSALSPAGFDPKTSDRVFRLAMSDIGEMVFLPPILRRSSRYPFLSSLARSISETSTLLSAIFQKSARKLLTKPHSMSTMCACSESSIAMSNERCRGARSNGPITLLFHRRLPDITA